MMSRIRGSNTKPEIIVRSLLHRAGYRFTLGGRNLPGRPDIVLPKHRTAIFVHGCFWHGHGSTRCPIAKIPKSNTEFWRNKITLNKKRDRKMCRQLRCLGWHVLIVWECQIMKDPKNVLVRLATRLEYARGRSSRLYYNDIGPRFPLKVAENRLKNELDEQSHNTDGDVS